MKAMKNLSLGRIMHSKKKDNETAEVSTNSYVAADAPPLDTPEANAERAVRSFCESGGPNGQQGEEVLYLPTIVDAAESSPKAANVCAYQIRKSLSHGTTNQKYNAIMLTRILSDNPGETFTRNLDAKFVSSIKDLLRQGNDLNVTQILIETLDNFEREKQYDINLTPLLAMWKKEQGRFRNIHVQRQTETTAMQAPMNNPNYFSRSHQYKGLPPPEELVSRIQEAKTSAQILSQLTRSTPLQDLLTNELVREFANRCQSASRSIQGYMVAEHPAPDNDTMLTLIETNDLLQRAQSQHQRVVLSARKELEKRDEKQSHIENILPPLGPPPSHLSRPVTDEVPLSFDTPTAENVTHASSSTSDPFQDLANLDSYHPGFNPTQSYMGRQNSAMGKITMHAALPTTPHMREGNEDLYSASSIDTSAEQTKTKGKQRIK